AAAWSNRGAALGSLGRYEEELEAYDRALAVEPENAATWSNRGAALGRLERHEEAIEAYDRVLAVDPEDAAAWSNRGAALGSLGRYEEELEAYDRALALDPDNTVILLSRGLAYRRFKRPQEAVGDLQKAISLGVQRVFARTALVELLLGSLKHPAEALMAARDAIEWSGGSAEVLNAMAWAFFEHGSREDLGEAEAWAHRAVEQNPEGGYYRHTLACLLGVRGKWRDALEQAAAFLNDREMLARDLDEVIDFFVDAVAAGNGGEVLRVIQTAGAEEALEPLVVAIRLMNGAQIDVAREIVEVAKDVAQRIEERRAAVQAD
ncbi:MAG TPA: tetratricopeptide repeat protein, partial [Longimicrobiaceae bacterium]